VPQFRLKGWTLAFAKARGARPANIVTEIDVPQLRLAL